MSAVWIAVIAAWGGGIIGVVGSLLKDRMQWTREHDVRYNQHRIEAYAEMLARGKLLLEYRFEERSAIDQIASPNPPDPFRDFHSSFELVQMVASQEVRKAVGGYYNALMKVWTEHLKRKAVLPGDAVFTRLYNDLRTAQEQFHAAVRHERKTD